MEDLKNIGADIRHRELSELNEELKNEIRTRGYNPITLNEKTDSSQNKIELVPTPGFSIFIYLSSGERVHINICGSTLIPAPKTASEDEIQRAINADPSSTWQVPMYLSNARILGDREKVYDAVINSKVLERADKDLDFQLYIIELSLEWVEDKYNVSLSRAFNKNNTNYVGAIETHLMQRTSMPYIDIASEKISVSTTPCDDWKQNKLARLPYSWHLIKTEAILVIELYNTQIPKEPVWVSQEGNGTILIQWNDIALLVTPPKEHAICQNAISVYSIQSYKVLVIRFASSRK